MTRTPPASSAAPGLPGGQQVLDHRVELLLRRVPGLEQVVVERDVVDRRDRRLGVGVGGEQHALGVRHELARLHEVLGARHARHALVGDQQRHLVAARAQLRRSSSASGPERGAHDPVALAEAAPQVARDGGEHRGLVVDRDDRGPSLAAAVGGLAGHAGGTIGRRRLGCFQVNDKSVSKAVLITGCSTGIGRATAERLAARGWTVYATARRKESIADLEAKGCRTLALDVCDEDSMQAAVEGRGGRARRGGRAGEQRRLQPERRRGDDAARGACGASSRRTCSGSCACASSCCPECGASATAGS